MNARNRMRRRKARARRTRYRGAFVQLTAEQLWRDTDPADDAREIIGAVQIGEPFNIQWHPLSISLIDGTKRYQVDGFYWRPLTMTELFDRNASGDWRGCRMIGGEQCMIDGIAPDH